MRDVGEHKKSVKGTGKNTTAVRDSDNFARFDFIGFIRDALKGPCRKIENTNSVRRVQKSDHVWRKQNELCRHEIGWEVR